ncbi:cytochrome b [Amnibacterium kyonggiense]|uniref:Cytochrome bc1 complex cytochrome b subunit n=1 Tax=Amnibacterium kyonggiense TaxID=595671 RepID=A0A4R7FL02_9MICO|nr:ubiquinol-cytochrome c reductase cytochrome b subunit [Amnibacterium kyonggiense]TDS77046.1 menaquinol-cytochrome c reductase cytochrome b subunit precursor [Amnibacterium kyonggiense]
MTTTSDTYNYDPTQPADRRQTGGVTGWASRYVDERTGISYVVREFGRKIFPDHWSFMLGEVALYSFVVILLTGTFLTFFFQASMAEVTYDGSYGPLKGLEMSAAMQSTLHISFEVRGGLLIRQVHHWAALLFVASIMLHMLRIFFTGAFRKPREINWVIGYVLWILAMAEGFTGYSLPDDLLSGNGLRIIAGMVEGIPFIGSWLEWLVFGGEFPGTAIVGRLYTLHILLLPAAVLAFIAIHLVFVVTHKHTQYAGPGRTNENVIGVPVLPVFAAKAGGFFFVVFGLLMAMGAFFTINPIWVYGPYDPSPVSAGTQPDWYIGFADGALRLMPGWLGGPGGVPMEFTILNTTYSLNILIPIVVLGLFIVAVMIYPFLEAWVTGDRREHHIADRPRNMPTRTAIGAAGATFYVVLFAGASSDLVATHFKLSIESVITILQFSLLLAPIAAYFIAKRICLALQKKDRQIVLHGYESGRIVRLPGGEYIEVHEPVDEYERWKLVSFNDYEPLMIRPNAAGRIPATERVRASLSRWFFEDRIEPVTSTELEVAHHH